MLLGLSSEQYMQMLTADNMAQMVGIIKPGQNSDLQSLIVSFQGEVKSLAEEETQLHNRIRSLVAACLIQVSSPSWLRF